MLKEGDIAIWKHPKGSFTNGKAYVITSKADMEYTHSCDPDTANMWPEDYWISVKQMTKLEKLIYKVTE